MAQQGKILSFNEVKRTAKGRPSVSAPKNTSASTTKSKQRNSVKTASNSSTSKKASVKTSGSRKAAAPKAAKPKTSVKNTKAASTKNARRTSQNTGSTPRVTENKKKETAKETQLSQMKRNLSKNKASKQFSKQFGDTSASAASEGPRAALYKGEMGRQHKKASKMQNGESERMSLFGRFSLPHFSLKGSPKTLASLTVIVGLVFSCIFLYPSAQQYYLSVRAHAQAEAEYDAVIARNEGIESQVNSLSSDEGIEDRARSEYGWVKEGENAVTVKGLDYEEDEVTYKKSVPSGSVEAPQTWYSPFLDFIFGVE